MSELLWKRMLREDPKLYRTRVAFFARKDPEALRAYLRSLPGAELLRHLEVLFEPGDSGPAWFEAADGGTLKADLGTWPEEATAEVEGWAEETCHRHGLPAPTRE